MFECSSVNDHTQAKRKLDKKSYLNLTSTVLPALVDRSAELREALSELPHVVSRASLTSVHRIISLTKISLAKYLQDVLPDAGKAKDKIIYHRTLSRRRSVDRVFNRAKELEKRPSVVDWTPPRRESSSSSDVIESPPGRIKPYRGSMVTLKEEDQDAYIIPEIVHILTRNSTPEAKRSSMSSLSTSASEDEKVDRGVWSEAMNSKGQRYFYNWKTKRMTFSNPHSPEYSRRSEGKGFGGGIGGTGFGNGKGSSGFGNGGGNGRGTGFGNGGSGFGNEGGGRRESWEIRVSEDGKRYYYNAARRRASWIHPDDLVSQVSTSPKSSTRSSLFSVPAPEDASKRIFLSDQPGAGGGDGEGGGGGEEIVDDTIVKTVVKDSLNVQISMLESEKAKWELKKREMENQIESLKSAVSRRDSDLQKELLHVAELEHELDLQHGTKKARSRSQHVADVITKLEDGVSSADEKCENIENKVMNLKSQRMSVMISPSNPSAGETVSMAKLRRKSLNLVRRTRAMTMPSHEILEEAKKRGGFKQSTDKNNNVLTNKIRIHVAGISGGQVGGDGVKGPIAKIQTKKGIRSRVVALDGWQLWELVYGHVFVVDTMLQLRDEFRARKKELGQGSGDASKGSKGVSRLRT